MNRTWARRVLTNYIEIPVARFLARLGISPNLVTLLGLLVAGDAAYLLSAGHLLPGGIVLLASGAFDMFDGALARATGQATKFGALLDSIVDRLAEAAGLLGLLIFYLHLSSTEGAVLVYLAVVGSFLVSYLRARAEGLGVECKIGIMTRPERVIALGAGLIVGHWWTTGVLVVLGLIGGLTLFTSAQRLFHVWRALRGQQ